jgi:hypothetical protein
VDHDPSHAQNTRSAAGLAGKKPESWTGEIPRAGTPLDTSHISGQCAYGDE